MRVLIACEESQETCKAFRQRGHDAYSCDLQECSGGMPQWHIVGDCLPILNGDCTFTTQAGDVVTIDGRWDLIIAHPPCTYISNAGACRLYPRKGQIDEERLKKGLAAKEFFLRILAADCDRIAVENPAPSHIFEMPKASQEIQPWYFGHPVTKRTRLWLKNLPPLFPTDVCAHYAPYVPSCTSRKQRDAYGAAKREGGDSKNRSKTFAGISAAMAEQWGSLGKYEDRSV